LASQTLASQTLASQTLASQTLVAKAWLSVAMDLSRAAALAAGAGLGVAALLAARRLTRYAPPEVWEPHAPPDAWGKEAVAALTGKPQSDAALSVGIHLLQLYSLGTPNGAKVTILLEELGVEYDAWRINIGAGEQLSSGFMAVNPNAMIPCMVDRTTSGEPVQLFESNSILLYLADKYGAFVPRAEAARADCISWLFWQSGSGPYFGEFNAHYFYKEPPHDKVCVDRYTLEAKRTLAVLNTRLAKTGSFICGGSEPTIADFSVFPWARLFRKRERAAAFLSLEEDYPAIVAWCERLGARKGVRRGVRVNGFTDDAVRERHAREDFEAEAY